MVRAATRTGRAAASACSARASSAVRRRRDRPAAPTAGARRASAAWARWSSSARARRGRRSAPCGESAPPPAAARPRRRRLPACCGFRSSLSSNSSMGSSSVGRLWPRVNRGRSRRPTRPPVGDSAAWAEILRSRLLIRRTSSPAARLASVISRSSSRRPSGSTAGAFASRSKPGDEIAQVVLHRLDLVLEARERALDLLDGPVGGHHPLDDVHPPDDVRRVEPARSAVLPLAPHAHRAGQQAELHVLAQRRLGEADPARLEDVDDLARGEAVRPGALDLLDLPLVEQSAQRRETSR